MASIRIVYPESSGCTLAGPGRGDCEHFVGLPGISIPDQHDGPDDTVDCYGKPNGWCWSCWKSYLLDMMRVQLYTIEEIYNQLSDYLVHSEEPNVAGVMMLVMEIGEVIHPTR